LWATLAIEHRPSTSVDSNLDVVTLRQPLAAESITVPDDTTSTTLPLNSPADKGRLYVKAGPTGGAFDVIVDGTVVRSGVFPANEPNPKPSLRFTSGLKGGETITVALLDDRDFPVAIRPVRIVQEVPDDQWRIRCGFGSRGGTVVNDSQGFLSLPTSTLEPLPLVPLLEFPRSAPAQTARVEVQTRDDLSPTGWKTVLGPADFVLKGANGIVDGDLHRVPLLFEESPPAAPASGQPAAPHPSKSFDFSMGLRFLLRVDDKELGPRYVWPEMFRTNRLISESADALRLEVSRPPGQPPRIRAFVTAAEVSDPRLPKSVIVTLDFDPALRELVAQGALTGTIVPGSGQTLR